MKLSSTIKLASMTLAIAAAIIFPACNREAEGVGVIIPGSNPAHGKRAMQSYGCVSCHTVPGIRGANALVGPNLDKISHRVYIAGVLPNTPENMVRWIQNPQAVDEKTAMPNLNVTEAEARDIAAYLYTLR